MDDGLVLVGQCEPCANVSCLNPYCNGRWSRTLNDIDYEDIYDNVLILIVMDDGLVLDLIRLY